MSIAEKETPLEMAERHAYAIYQDFISVMAIRLSNPDADLSSVRDELLETHETMGKILKGWK